MAARYVVGISCFSFPITYSSIARCVLSAPRRCLDQLREFKQIRRDVLRSRLCILATVLYDLGRLLVAEDIRLEQLARYREGNGSKGRLDGRVPASSGNFFITASSGSLSRWVFNSGTVASLLMVRINKRPDTRSLLVGENKRHPSDRMNRRSHSVPESGCPPQAGPGLIDEVGVLNVSRFY